jgi:hypothetical protein
MKFGRWENLLGSFLTSLSLFTNTWNVSTALGVEKSLWSSQLSRQAFPTAKQVFQESRLICGLRALF